MKTVAVILAGGTGSRVGGNVPKQFFMAAGRTIIEHTIDAFENNASIDEIAVVIHPEFAAQIEKMVITNGWHKVKKMLNGGKERYHSSMAAIKAYENEEDCCLLFHDAVRPLVSQRIISEAAGALEKYNAVCTAVPSVDTVMEMDEGGSFIHNIPNRSVMWRIQTPQGFRLPLIKKAYDLAMQDMTFAATDDCGVVKRYLPHEKIYVVRGEESNMKLTYKEDLPQIERLLQQQNISQS